MQQLGLISANFTANSVQRSANFQRVLADFVHGSFRVMDKQKPR